MNATYGLNDVITVNGQRMTKEDYLGDLYDKYTSILEEWAQAHPSVILNVFNTHFVWGLDIALPDEILEAAPEFVQCRSCGGWTIKGFLYDNKDGLCFDCYDYLLRKDEK